MSSGILNLDKPCGPTSHDMVQEIRRLIGVRRVGHAGTLDPLATGVLLICVGQATRVAEYLRDSDKAYQATAHLGIATDTYDVEGNITRQVSPTVTRQDVEGALDQFRGVIQQAPPVYAAIKHHGQPLHRLVRQGAAPERESLQPRQVEISHLAMVDWAPPLFTIAVVCSSGTYIRALVHDIGEALGCGAHVTALVRERSGGFLRQDAVQLEGFAQAVTAGRWQAMLHPIYSALSHLPELHVDSLSGRRLCSGQMIPASPSTQPFAMAGDHRLGCEMLIRVYGPGDTFLAIAKYNPTTHICQPHKVFCTPESIPSCN
ncbi:MAG: tRNA pseudouridine(55) synthase TruB [Chloroflexi bacterium]|nr:tRNA pseudouridine(55) synthase TruB [Chloroflexota bacterium]